MWSPASVLLVLLERASLCCSARNAVHSMQALECNRVVACYLDARDAWTPLSLAARAAKPMMQCSTSHFGIGRVEPTPGALVCGRKWIDPSLTNATTVGSTCAKQLPSFPAVPNLNFHVEI
jgi:hypothetical protein